MIKPYTPSIFTNSFVIIPTVVPKPIMRSEQSNDPKFIDFRIKKPSSVLEPILET